MLKIVIFPHIPFICTTVTSPEGKSNCFQLSVEMFALMSVTDLDLAGVVLCVVGYIGIQFLAAIVSLLKLIAGSWIAMMSMFSFRRCSLLMRSCCDVGDLLVFCCHIVSLHIIRHQILRIVIAVLPHLCCPKDFWEWSYFGWFPIYSGQSPFHG